MRADARSRRREKGGDLTGPSPVGRGKAGSKMHVLSDANGLPLVVGLSAANTHDSQAPKPMITGLQTRHDPHRGRHFKPQRLHADKAYDIPHLRKWLRGKRIGVCIARKGIESSERLGRRRRVIERTMSWLTGYHRLNHRYERHPRNYLAFLGLAAGLCCYKRLVRLTS
ncbi:IS5 family transposase [Streptomyces sp. P9-A4]